MVYSSFLNQPYMFRATNSLILRTTFWLYIQMELTFRLNRGTGRQECRCIVPKAVYTVLKYSWGWANLSPETCTADLKTTNKRKSCCISLVAYIAVLEIQGHTNTTYLNPVINTLACHRRLPATAGIQKRWKTEYGRKILRSTSLAKALITRSIVCCMSKKHKANCNHFVK